MRNTVGASRRDGIRLDGANGALVTQNVLYDNLWVISVSGTADATVQRNRVMASPGTGVAVFDGSVGTHIGQNDVTGGWADGIRTSPGTSGWLVMQDTTSYNSWDEITVVASTATKNTSTFNRWLGIRAVSSVDGGGNNAAFNGEPGQCEGVACTAP